MDYFRLQGGGLEYLWSFVTSGAIGLLIGLERERSPAARAGLRTFAIVALLGTLSAMLSARTASPWPLVAGFLAVALLIVVAYLGKGAASDPGTTTEAALLLCYGLGAAVWFGYATLAVMLAIVATVLLYFKPELHGFTQKLERHDLLSILQFGVLTFVVLPILPDRGFGPGGALNPHNIWLMVVLISGISLAGYVALRAVGRRYGAPLLGLLGGVVSSTATTLVYARHGKSYEAMGRLAVSVILLANLVVLVRLAILGLVVAPEVLPRLLPVLGSGLALGLAATALGWRSVAQREELPVPQTKNPTELKTSLFFGLLYAGVLFLIAWLSGEIGDKGVYGVALVSGLTDVDAITLSSLRLFNLGTLHADQAVTAIILALCSNLVFKAGLVLAVGGPVMARRCLPGFLGVGIGAALWLL